MDAGKKKGIKDFATYDTNRFEPEGIVVKFRKVKGKDDLWLSVETGEYHEVQRVDRTVEIEVDERPFVKLFRDSIIDAGTLSIPAYRLMLYIMLTIKPNRDYITVNVDDFLDTFGYAKPEARQGERTPQRNTVHYYRAVAELLEKEYICKRRGGEQSFFINLNKFFNGNRLLAKPN